MPSHKAHGPTPSLEQAGQNKHRKAQPVATHVMMSMWDNTQETLKLPISFSSMHVSGERKTSAADWYCCGSSFPTARPRRHRNVTKG
ncbi:hypothetical protein SASPL_146452 [Salvia splendens]|uniref:Uncharacterized protein n=1 Tax=Salvia splendens TaxID=180675 RepID=A0A8X8WDA6_SALSN|nr:hypothetical protein SASPL_146452 [Salvia splendens]